MLLLGVISPGSKPKLHPQTHLQAASKHAAFKTYWARSFQVRGSHRSQNSTETRSSAQFARRLFSTRNIFYSVASYTPVWHLAHEIITPDQNFDLLEYHYSLLLPHHSFFHSSPDISGFAQRFAGVARVLSTLSIGSMTQCL